MLAFAFLMWTEPWPESRVWPKARNVQTTRWLMAYGTLHMEVAPWHCPLQLKISTGAVGRSKAYWYHDISTHIQAIMGMPFQCTSFGDADKKKVDLALPRLSECRQIQSCYIVRRHLIIAIRVLFQAIANCSLLLLPWRQDSMFEISVWPGAQ